MQNNWEQRQGQGVGIHFNPTLVLIRRCAATSGEPVINVITQTPNVQGFGRGSAFWIECLRDHMM